MTSRADAFYHEGSRRLQDASDSRRLADALVDVTLRTEFSAADREMIEQSSMFFLATADADGRPECNHKGGDPGFVRVVGDRVLVFPDYDGNGMFRSLGNITVNPSVSLLFIDFHNPRRLRINGTAELLEGASPLVRVTATHIFPNCPRYIHPMRREGLSPYVPRNGETPPEPAWKDHPGLRDALPARR
jgi:hypothetical protein